MKSFVMRRCARSPFSREIERKATQIRRAAVGIDDGVIRVLRIQIPACCSEHEPVRRAYHGLQLDTAGARLSHVGRGLDEGVVRPWQRRCPLKIRSEEHTSELQSLMRISYAV